MTKRSYRFRQPPRAEAGSILLEAVLAAVLAISTLAIIAPMFSKQIEQARRARDTDLLEVAATKDTNALRQFARYWRMKSGPYSSSFLTASATGFTYSQRQSESIGYQPTARSECLTKDSYLRNFFADLKPFALKSASIEVVNPPRIFNLAEDVTPTGLSSRYLLTRTLQNLSNDPSVSTMVVTYKLSPLNGAPPLAFERSAELGLEMHTGC